MSFLKAVGIDVGIIQKGLSYQISLANARINSLDADAIGYTPEDTTKWAVCGCDPVDHVGEALNALASIRAHDIDEINDLDSRVTTLEGGGGLSNWAEDASKHLLPSTNDSQDIGSATKKVRDLYLGPNSLKIVDAGDSIASYGKDWFEGRVSTVSLGNIKVSLGNVKQNVESVDTRVSGLETLQAYTIDSLPATANVGKQVLVSDGADTGVALAYHFDRAWYRSFDNVVLADSKWSPADTTTELWYDASDLDSLVVSGTNLTQWGDKSGNGYHLTKDQNANSDTQSGTASLRGRNVIEFGSGDSMTNVNWSHVQNTTAIYAIFVTKAYVDTAQDFLLHHTPSTGIRMALRRTSTNQYQWLGSNADDSSVASTGLLGIPEDEDTIGILKINGSNSSISKYNQSGSDSKTGNFGTRNLEHISIGSNESEGSNLVGYFAEVIYFTASADVEKFEGYLAHKWGLSAYLPSDHIYKNSAP
jgi:hypothetical protein